jgi:hypothetical protein
VSNPGDSGWNNLVSTAAIATLSLILGLVFGSVFATGCESVREAPVFGCVEFVLFRYQTLLVIFGALTAAILIAQPIWRHLRQVEKQSAMQFYEMLRRHMALVEWENALMAEARLEASHAIIVEEQIQECISNLSDPSGAVEGWVKFSRERYDALIELIRKVEAARADIWGNEQDAEIARGRILIDLIKLKGATLQMWGELEAIRLRNAAAGNIATSVWIADKQVLRELTVVEESSNVERSAIVYSKIAEREIARLSPVLATTAKAAME